MKKYLILIVFLIIIMNVFGQNHTLLEPNNTCVYHGVQTMNFDNDKTLSGYLGALNDTILHPAVRGFFMGIPSERGPNFALAGFNDFLHSADSIGYIPELSLFFVGKIGANVVPTDSIIALSNQYDWIIDSIITLCKNRNRSMFLRIGGEFNGQGPGWNGGGYHPYLYVTMFQKIVNMFAARGFRDSVATNWCYEPDAANDFDSVDSKGPRWYPGDSYVNWFGLDVFDAVHFDQALPDSIARNITKKGKSERFLAMARAKGKPVFLSETSAKGINISANNNDGIDDWNNWFAKFFHFIEVHNEIKGFCYINTSWPVSAYPNWGEARIQNSGYVSLKYKTELAKPRYINLKGTGCNGSVGQIEFPEIDPQFTVYPNPACAELNIEFGSKNSFPDFELTDAKGMPLKNINFFEINNMYYTLNTQNLAEGIYILSFTLNEVRQFQKVMVVK
ncbi:MAG: T9SS type A sorting domain-containing protein [Bacteroidota bacterium]|nr:T9SS type A sorting domain-containing protein [Bacteroidota bacterium]